MLGGLFMLVFSFKLHIEVKSCRRNNGELQTAGPFFSRLQGYWLSNCCTIHAEHLLVLFIPKIHYWLWFFLPGIPNNYSMSKLTWMVSFNYLSCLCNKMTEVFPIIVLRFWVRNVICLEWKTLTNIWKTFLSYHKCSLPLVI